MDILASTHGRILSPSGQRHCRLQSSRVIGRRCGEAASRLPITLRLWHGRYRCPFETTAGIAKESKSTATSRTTTTHTSFARHHLQIKHNLIAASGVDVPAMRRCVSLCVCCNSCTCAWSAWRASQCAACRSLRSMMRGLSISVLVAPAATAGQ